MSKKNVKMGEDIVDQPDTQIVTETPPEGVEAALADTVAADPPAAEAAAEPPVEVEAPPPAPAPPPPDPGTTLLLENGQRVALAPHVSNLPFPQFRIGAGDGHTYDHCGDDPVTGEWLYRRMS